MVNDSSDDGAIAAAEFFIEAYEYAYRASDDSPLQRIFDKECDFCEEISEKFEEFDRRRHHAPDINFHDMEFMHSTDHEGDLYVIHRANIYNLSIIDKDKNIINEIEDDYYSFSLRVKYSEEKWVIIGGDIRRVDELESN